MSKYKFKSKLVLSSLGLLCFPSVISANESSSVTTTASITFSAINDESEVYPYNPFGEGYLEFTSDPGGVQDIGNEDLKLMWISNFAFIPENSVYDYLNQSTGTPKDVQAYVKQDAEDKATDKKITMEPLIQVWNSDKVSWDLKVQATDFVPEDKDPQKTSGIPMKIHMNELVRGDTFKNSQTLPRESDQNITNFVSNEPIVLSERSRNLISFNNQQHLSGFSTYFFKSNDVDPESKKLPLALSVPKEQRIEAKKVYHADVTWTLATRLEP